MNEPDLLLLLLAPLVLSLPIYLTGKKMGPENAKWGTVVIISLSTLYTLILWLRRFINLDPSEFSDGFLYHFKADWVPSIGMVFSVGVDGLSMPLLLLTQFVFLISVISSFYIKEQEPTYYAMILVLLSGVIGTFIALDMFLFYIAWELVLVPMFFIIHIWGGANRKYAAIKFFIYTHLASLVMLIGLFIIYLNGYTIVDGIKSYTFYLPDIQNNLAINFAAGNIELSTLTTIFWLVFIGFVTKFPQVPVHTWLPDAHVQAPSPGSAILAGLLLKMGGYGLIRIPFWLFADIEVQTLDRGVVSYFETLNGQTVRIIIAIIGMISMVYPAFIALRQDDLKRMIAYSSISHMGIVLLGLAAYNTWGLNGAMYMMIAHGVISPGLFLLTGIIEHNTTNHTRLISQVGGLGHKMPFATGLFVLLGFGSAGLPGMAGFVAEFTTFVALFTSDLIGYGTIWVWIPVISVMSIIITAGYYLWAIQRVLFNKETEELTNTTPAQWWEIYPVLALAFFSILLGLVPGIFWTVLDFFTESILP